MCICVYVYMLRLTVEVERIDRKVLANWKGKAGWAERAASLDRKQLHQVPLCIIQRCRASVREEAP